MNLSSAALSRADFYDRDTNYLVGNISLSGVAPHALTDRVILPLNPFYVYHLEQIYLYIRRATVATTAGLATAGLRLYSFSEGIDALAAQITHSSNVANSIVEISIPINMWTTQNISYRLATSDSSSGGTMDYYLAIYGIAVPLWGSRRG